MIEVLSVTLGVFPLIKTGGPGRRDRCAARRAGGAGVTMRTLIPGYPAVMDEASGKAQVVYRIIRSASTGRRG